VIEFDDSPIGQVGGVAISSALFQSRLDSELRARIHTPHADKVGSAMNRTNFRVLTHFDQLIMNIRQSTSFVNSLPPELQREAHISYTLGIKSVFYFAAVCAFLAYLIRIPVCLAFKIYLMTIL